MFIGCAIPYVTLIMAALIKYFLIIGVYLFYQADEFSCFKSIMSAKPLPCAYPKGSLSCKAWNYTNMDCSYRDLGCIPPIRRKSKLELLDLSHNKLYTLTENAFDGFYNFFLYAACHKDQSLVHFYFFYSLMIICWILQIANFDFVIKFDITYRYLYVQWI